MTAKDENESPQPVEPPEKGLVEKLWASDEAIVSDAYEIGFKRLAAEDAITSRIDTKATGLFGVVGFAMTLAFSFGGWPLLDNTRKVPLGWLIASLFIVALLIGLYTAWNALSALKVRTVRVVDEKEVFDDELLGRDKKAYRAVIAAHVWYIAQENYGQNREKARFLERGQYSFGVFLCAILALSCLTAGSAISRAPDPPPPAPTIVCPSAVAPSVFVSVPAVAPPSSPHYELPSDAGPQTPSAARDAEPFADGLVADSSAHPDGSP